MLVLAANGDCLTDNSSVEKPSQNNRLCQLFRNRLSPLFRSRLPRNRVLVVSFQMLCTLRTGKLGCAYIEESGKQF